jgi:hypothetical protein
MAIDLSNPRVRDCFDSMLQSAAETLAPEQLVKWHHRIENCDNLDQASEVTSEMCGRPMTESEKRIAREVRNSWILMGSALGAGEEDQDVPEEKTDITVV